MLARSGVPSEYRGATYDRCRVASHLDHWRGGAKDLLHQGRGEMIFGSVGTGKSSTAALLAGEAVKVRAPVLWRYVPDLCDQLLSGSRTRAETIAMVTRPALLVLDDFGVRPFSEFEVGLLDQIFENRYRRRRSVVITTNLLREDIMKDERLARMVDRWRQTCGVITISGSSQRHTT